MSQAIATPRKVLVVDDDDPFRERLCASFRAHGFAPTSCESGTKALEQIAEEPHGYAVVDLRMPGMEGLELLRQLRAVAPSCRVVVLTGYGSIATALEAVRQGAVHYLTKPASLKEILRAFEHTASATESQPAVHEVPSLARTEWEHIQRVLRDCNGNVSQAAKLLGVHRRSLQRKLAKYPVKR